MLGLKEQEPAEPRTRATVWPQNPPPGCGGGGRGSRPGAKVEQMVKRREWEGGLAAAKSRAFAGTITMETVEGRKDPAPHFLGPENEFFSLLRRVPVRTTSPSGRWTSPFASKELCTPRAAGTGSSETMGRGCVSPSGGHGAHVRSLRCPTDPPRCHLRPLTFSPSHHLVPSAPPITLASLLFF